MKRTIAMADNCIDVYCADTNVPFHIQATKHTPDQVLDYIWGTLDDNENGEF